MTDTKVCRCCGKEKPLTAFWKHQNKHDGRHTQCAECQQAQRAARIAANQALKGLTPIYKDYTYETYPRDPVTKLMIRIVDLEKYGYE